MAGRKLILIGCASLALAAAGCGGGGEGGSAGGSVQADGSSTVGPYMTAAAEQFRDVSDARVTVGISGTGGGFERFCRGETDLSNASRPLKDEEAKVCEENGVEWTRLEVANDALTVVVNTQNDWATCLTVEELKRIWEPGSKVKSWDQVRSGFPKEELKLFGPGTDSGTFDYFTEEIVGKDGASRTDFSASEDDNVVVQGVGGTKGGLGYFGFSYFEENAGTLKAVEIDGGDGCVAPSAESAQDGTYTPLSRSLFVYVKHASLARPEVQEFLRFVLDNETAIAERARFVPLADDQLEEQRQKLDEAIQAG